MAHLNICLLTSWLRDLHRTGRCPPHTCQLPEIGLPTYLQGRYSSQTLPAVNAQRNCGTTTKYFSLDDGMETLKEGLNDAPYPIFWIDMNGDNPPSEDKWLSLGESCNHLELVRFCEDYIQKTDGIIRPFINNDKGNQFTKRPAGYTDAVSNFVVNGYGSETGS